MVNKVLESVTDSQSLQVGGRIILKFNLCSGKKISKIKILSCKLN